MDLLSNGISLSKEPLTQVCGFWYFISFAVSKYQSRKFKIKSKEKKLFKARDVYVDALPEDHDLTEICKNIELFTLDCDHTSILAIVFF